jgi:hypothetical protein
MTRVGVAIALGVRSRARLSKQRADAVHYASETARVATLVTIVVIVAAAVVVVAAAAAVVVVAAAAAVVVVARLVAVTVVAITAKYIARQRASKLATHGWLAGM